MADSRPEIRVKGITANTIVTVLMALGAGGGGLAAYKNWPDSGPIVAAVDEAARSAAATLTADFANNRTKTWEAINGLKETQSKTAANLDVLTNNVNNLTETVKQGIAADLARDQRQDVQDDRQDDRLLDLERRTP